MSQHGQSKARHHQATANNRDQRLYTMITAIRLEIALRAREFRSLPWFSIAYVGDLFRRLSLYLEKSRRTFFGEADGCLSLWAGLGGTQACPVKVAYSGT